MVTAAAVTWLAIAARKVATRSVPGLLAISALVLTLQTAVVLITGSELFFLLQFPLANLALCVLFARTAPTRKPLVAQLAAEVVALRPPPSPHPGLDRFFHGATWLWAGIFAVSAAGLAAGWPSSLPRCFSCLPPPSPSAAWSRAPSCRPCGLSGCCAVPASAFASARSDGRRHHLCRDHPCEDRRAGSARRTRIPRPPRTATLSRRPSPTSRRSCCLTAGGSRAGSAWRDRGIRHAAATPAMQSTGPAPSSHARSPNSAVSWLMPAERGMYTNRGTLKS